MVTSDTVPSEVGQYFSTGRRKIVTVSAQTNFSLILEFDNGEKRQLDMKEILKGNVFAPFRNFDRFKDVFVDSHGCIGWDIDPAVDSETVWNNRVDLCSDSCYLDSIPLEI